MFYSEGEFYCINGCLECPPKSEKIKAFLSSVSAEKSLQNVYLYSTPTEDAFRISDCDWAVLDLDYAVSRLDFTAEGYCFRLMFDYWNGEHYGASVFYSNELGVPEEVREKLALSFYNAFKPVYGNRGVEESLLPLNEICDEYAELFTGEVIISGELLSCLKDMLMDSKISALEGNSDLYAVNFTAEEGKAAAGIIGKKAPPV